MRRLYRRRLERKKMARYIEPEPSKQEYDVAKAAKQRESIQTALDRLFGEIENHKAYIAALSERVGYVCVPTPTGGDTRNVEGESGSPLRGALNEATVRVADFNERLRDIIGSLDI
jgi:hypothetical protein